MSGWVWDCVPKEGKDELSIEHDGTVRVSIIADGDTWVDTSLDAEDFERMCHSFIERMADWRRRISNT